METAAEKVARIKRELAQANKEASEDVADIGFTNGDLYDEDSGEHLGTFDVKDAHEGKEIDTIPASLSVYMNGYFYVYVIQRRYKEGEKDGKEEADRIQT